MPQGKKSRGGKAVKSEKNRPPGAQTDAELDHIKGDLIAHFLREKLQEDERTTALNLLKMKDGWRSNLRRSKSTEKKNDMHVLEQTFRNSSTIQGSPISNMDPNADGEDRHLYQLHSSHLRHIQSLVELHERHKDILEQEWESTFKNTALKRGQDIAAEPQQNQNNILQIQHSYDEEYCQILDSLFEIPQMPKVIEALPAPERPDLQLKDQIFEKKMTGALIEENKAESRKDDMELQLLENKSFGLNMLLISNDHGLSTFQQQLVVINEEAVTKVSDMRHREHLSVLSEHSDKAATGLLNALNIRQNIVCLAKQCKKQEENLPVTDQLELPHGNELTEEALRRRRDALSCEKVLLQLHLQQHEENTMMVHGHSLQRNKEQLHLQT
ncbi:unnamed protein product [Knipowitschia caucasica]|uniref:Dynein regulatory complex protein 1/2 N-terminal domain-containing protein n=1 Tax=Knipowitschia caucasica TaxID=637954 RepID=A0AAV2LST1_KNICA